MFYKHEDLLKDFIVAHFLQNFAKNVDSLTNFSVFYPYTHHQINCRLKYNEKIDFWVYTEKHCEGKENNLFDCIQYFYNQQKFFHFVYLSRILEHNKVDDIRYLFYLLKKITNTVYSLTPNHDKIATIIINREVDFNCWDFKRLCLEVFNEPDPNDPYSSHVTWTNFDILSTLAKSEGWSSELIQTLEVDYSRAYNDLIVYRYRTTT